MNALGLHLNLNVTKRPMELTTILLGSFTAAPSGLQTHFRRVPRTRPADHPHLLISTCPKCPVSRRRTFLMLLLLGLFSFSASAISSVQGQAIRRKLVYDECRRQSCRGIKVLFDILLSSICPAHFATSRYRPQPKAAKISRRAHCAGALGNVGNTFHVVIS